MSRFFIRRPIVAIVIAIVTVLGGLVVAVGAADRAVPGDRPAADQRDDDLHRRRRADHRAVGRDAARAADERRRQHALHAVDQRQRRHDDAEGHVRRRHRCRTSTRSTCRTACRRRSRNLPPEVKHFGVTMRKATGFPLLVISLYVAEAAPTTRCSSPTTRPSTSTTRSTACRASARSASSAPATTRCASGSSPTRWPRSASPCPTSRNAIQQQSTVNPAGQIGARAGAAGPGDHLHRPRAGAAVRRGGVRRRSSSARTRTARWCGCKDVARIELGALNYQQIGRVNGKPGGVIAVFQMPGSNALDVADGVKTTMAELQRRASRADMDYRSRSTRRCRSPKGIHEIAEHARRGDRAGHHRRLHLPAELARDADPADGRAGVADRRVRRLPAARLLDQHAVAASASSSPSASSSTTRSSWSRRSSTTSSTGWRRARRRSRRWRRCRARSSASR